MEYPWAKVEGLRAQYDLLREDRTPIDIFSFFEIDLELDPIHYSDLTAQYRVEAVIKSDFTGTYLDAEQYSLMEKRPDWKLNRIRFTVIHELAHYFSKSGSTPGGTFFLHSRFCPMDSKLRR